MWSSGIEFDIEQRNILRLREQGIAQARFFRTVGTLWHHAGGERRFILDKPVGQIVLRLGVSGHDCAIALLCLVATKLRGEPRCGFAGLCKRHHAANRAVEPVHKAEICLAGFAVSVAQIHFEQREQVLVAGAVRLHGQVDGLFDHEEVVVFI